MFRKKPREINRPTVEPDLGLAIYQVAVGTSLTNLVTGDYREYKVILIANPANVGDMTIGKGDTKDTITFPLLKTAYLEFEYDLDKVKALGTDASDKVDVILEKRKSVVK